MITMATPNGASSVGSDKETQDVQTQQNILDKINQLLQQKIELDIRTTAKSLGKDDVDVASIMSDKLVQRELRSLERHVSGFIDICEDMLHQKIEDLVAPELVAERENQVAEPLPEYMIVEEPLIDEIFGLRGAANDTATTTTTTTTAHESNAHDMEEEDDDGLHLTEEEIRSIRDPTNRDGKALYFFYGSLMDPGTLQRVTGLPAVPRMRPAHVSGFVTKLWGPYPALVGGRARDVVRGVACEIEGARAKRRLEEYEGANYTEWDLEVRLDRPDGTWEEVQGTTFKWVGPRDELEDGVFDLGKWLDS